MQGSLLNEHGGQIPAALVERRLDDRTGGRLVRIRLEIEEVGFKQHLFKQFVDIDSLLR